MDQTWMYRKSFNFSWIAFEITRKLYRIIVIKVIKNKSP